MGGLRELWGYFLIALLSTLAASATTSYLRLHAATVSAALGAVG